MNLHHTPEVTHAAVLLRSDQQWLLQLRDERPDIIQPGAVSLWGGGRHDDETPPEAAARELLEETRLQVDPNELELLTVLNYEETKLSPGNVIENIDVVSAVYLVRRDHIPPFDVQEGQGLLYVPLARLFMPESARLRTTQELDLTLNHLVEFSHVVVAEALNLPRPTVESTLTEEDFINYFGSGAADSFGSLVRAIANQPDFPLQPSAEDPNKLVGDIDLAIHWMASNYRGPYDPTYRSILEKIRIARLNLPQL